MSLNVSSGDTTTLPSQLTVGKTVIITSKSLNLASSSQTDLDLLDDNSNVLLQISIRPDEDRIIFSSKAASGSWTNQHIVSDLPTVIGSSSPVKIRVENYASKFTIYTQTSAALLDYTKIAELAAKNPTKIAYSLPRGGVSVLATAVQVTAGDPADVSTGDTTTLPSQLTAGKTVTITSQTLNLASSAQTDLDLLDDDSNVLLQISIRPDEDRVIFRSKAASGSWTNQHIVSDLPTVIGSRIPVQIQVEQYTNKFTIYTQDSGPLLDYTKIAELAPKNAARISYSLPNGGISVLATPIQVIVGDPAGVSSGDMTTLPSQLTVGKMVTITSQTLNLSTSSQTNFELRDDNADILLQISIRPDEDRIVFSSQVAGRSSTNQQVVNGLSTVIGSEIPVRIQVEQYTDKFTIYTQNYGPLLDYIKIAELAAKNATKIAYSLPGGGVSVLATPVQVTVGDLPSRTPSPE